MYGADAQQPGAQCRMYGVAPVSLETPVSLVVDVNAALLSVGQCHTRVVAVIDRAVGNVTPLSDAARVVVLRAVKPVDGAHNPLGLSGRGGDEIQPVHSCQRYAGGRGYVCQEIRCEPFTARKRAPCRPQAQARQQGRAERPEHYPPPGGERDAAHGDGQQVADDADTHGCNGNVSRFDYAHGAADVPGTVSRPVNFMQIYVKIR